MRLREIRLTPSEKYSVSAMVPKYAAVNGSRGPEVRCCTGGAGQRLIRWRPEEVEACLPYCIGPIMTAHEAKKSTEPMVHLRKEIER